MRSSLRSPRRVPPGLAIVGLGLLWGAAFPAIDAVVSEIPPLTAAAIRYAVSGCIVLAYAAATTDRLVPRSRRELLGIAVVGSFVFGGYQAGLYLGTQYVSGAVASVVATMAPVLAALVAVPILGESRGLLDLGGFVLGVAGVVVIAQPAPGSGSLSTTGLGVGLVFLGVAMFAIGSVSVQLFDEGLPTESLQGWAMLVGASLLVAGAVVRGESPPSLVSVSPVALGSLVYVTLVAGAGGYLLYFRLVSHVGATETTLVSYIEPLSATLVAVALFGEPVRATTVAGFLAVAAGFAIVSRETMRALVGSPGRGAEGQAVSSNRGN
ncbi:DMT family transporter [Haloarchaeobius sp. TZWWS8]|uniref:DMT family transporter n=1 Tax=Haloarchaeobius sp. TZWWS8 TaxID=3446121 RepID=UPI003EBCF2A1